MSLRLHWVHAWGKQYNPLHGVAIWELARSLSDCPVAFNGCNHVICRDLFLHALKREGGLHKHWRGATPGRSWKVWSTSTTARSFTVISREAISCATQAGISSWLTLGVPNKSAQWVVPIQRSVISYPIAGNFQGRKLSRISQFFSHPGKFSPRNSRHATPIMWPVLTFRESFLHKMLLSYWSVKVFSLENFPLYGMLLH